MSNIVTWADVQNEIPGLDLSATSTPSVPDVVGYIGDIEGEVQAHLTAYGSGMPDPETPEAALLKRIILEGCRWLTLRGMFAASRSEFVPDDVRDARDTYREMLKEIRIIAQAIRKVNPAMATSSLPLLGTAQNAPTLGVSFTEYTQYVAGQWPRRIIR